MRRRQARTNPLGLPRGPSQLGSAWDGEGKILPTRLDRRNEREAVARDRRASGLNVSGAELGSAASHPGLGRVRGRDGFADCFGPPRRLRRSRVRGPDLREPAQLRLLRSWTGGAPWRWSRVRSRLRWLCVVERDHPRYAPWGPSDSPWVEEIAVEHLRQIPLDSRLWRYLAEDQPKTTDSFVSRRWSDPGRGAPPSEVERLRAARFARSLYRQGRWSRARLAAQLMLEAEEDWARDLARDLGSPASS